MREHDDVLEDDREGDRNRPERGERVEAGERRRDCGRDCKGHQHQAENAQRPPVLEDPRAARAREPLHLPDAPHDEGDRLGGGRCAEIAPVPAGRQPDRPPAEHHLGGEKDGDRLEDVCHPAGRERQGRHEHQQHDRDREALLREHVVHPAERLRLVAEEPALELVAERAAGSFVHPIMIAIQAGLGGLH